MFSKHLRHNRLAADISSDEPDSAIEQRPAPAADHKSFSADIKPLMQTFRDGQPEAANENVPRAQRDKLETSFARSIEWTPNGRGPGV